MGRLPGPQRAASDVATACGAASSRAQRALAPSAVPCALSGMARSHYAATTPKGVGDAGVGSGVPQLVGGPGVGSGAPQRVAHDAAVTCGPGSARAQPRADPCFRAARWRASSAHIVGCQRSGSPDAKAGLRGAARDFPPRASMRACWRARVLGLSDRRAPPEDCEHLLLRGRGLVRFARLRPSRHRSSLGPYLLYLQAKVKG